MFKKLFRFGAAPEPRTWSVPPGKRIYAIGDIHGRLDLLDELLGKIVEDGNSRGSSDVRIIILGDLMDRGLQSRGVIERLMQISDETRNMVFIAGNHEELMIRAWEGDRNIMAVFNRAGGKETLLSYGMTAEEYDTLDLGEIMHIMPEMIPAEHIEFLKSFADWQVEGDYLFVHAGIRPGIALEDQTSEDLRWIRGGFLDSDEDFGYMVIHGHTITKEVDERPNRIGIDTGAFKSGVLTAIALEGSERWYLST